MNRFSYPLKTSLVLVISLWMSGCNGFDSNALDADLFAPGFKDANSGEYNPLFNSPELPSYWFFLSSVDPEVKENGIDGPFLTVEYWNRDSNEFRIKRISLAFTPTAISGPDSTDRTVVIGGRDANENAVLVRFDFEFSASAEIGIGRIPFADVSSLSRISDLQIFKSGEGLSALVFDGHLGQFGRVKENEKFLSLVSTEVRRNLVGKRSFFGVFPDSPSRLLAFSVVTANESGREEEGELVILEESPDSPNWRLHSN